MMVKEIYRELRRICADNVRGLCIKQNYYTHGNCEEYENMFEKCRVYNDNPTTENLKSIAMDIVIHSDDSCFVDSGEDTIYALTCLVMYELMHDCIWISYDYVSIEE